MRAAALSLALVLLLAPLAASAWDDEDAAQREQWQQRVIQARAKVRSARERLATAEARYSRMRSREKTRGEAKEAIEQELEEARRALAAAEQELEALPEVARRAGVPPGWLRIDGKDPTDL